MSRAQATIGVVVRAALAMLGVVAVLAGCTGPPDQLVEVPTTRPPAVVVQLERSTGCPPDTVLLDDPDPASGAGTIPAGFDGRVLLRCEVDHTTMTSHDGVDRFTVRQWRARLSTELQQALALPDREYRSGRAACGASAGGTTVLYVVDGRGRAVRVLAPKDGPCHDIRPEVEALLPDVSTPAGRTFHASRREG